MAAGGGRRRAPEMPVLHEAFRRGWPGVSSSMPSRVKREVEQYLRCGDLRYGFVEVSCEVATLERVRVVPASPQTGRLRFGSTITLELSDGRKQTMRLVGPDEVNVKKGLISVESPLARSLIEREAGDEVEVERPRGLVAATILSIE